MASAPQARRLLRFGEFQLDVQSGELRRSGMTVRLADQPFRLLLLLLERAGEVVTREELRDTLWAADTFVDFDTGLNSIVRKLRDVLGDSAEHPRFIETLPRRGYRFIAVVTPGTPEQIPQPDARGAETTGPRSLDEARDRPEALEGRARLAWIAGALVVAAAIGTAALALQRGWWDRVGADAAGAGAASPAERDLLGRRAIDPAAYEAYMKGVAAAGLLTYEGHRNAVAYFEDAVAKQPDFAMAYARLGSSQLQFLWVGPLSPRETVPNAEAATRKALQLDDTLPVAHRTLAGILRNYYWRSEDADKELQRAGELGSPAESSTMELIQSGQFAMAIAQAERARRSDPLSFEAAASLASAFRAAGQYDRAIAEYRTALQITPRRPRGHFQLGVTFVFMGRLKEAIDELETAVRLSSGNSRFDAYLAFAYAASGRPADARRILKELEARARKQYVSGFGLALIYDALGEKEPALAAFERAYQDRAVEFAQMRQYPPFKTIASDPRFQARMAEIGLPR
jgi:DNA-binding winged helix-turn-helix (wHTH) protein/tetratricopeptide (TPR) repeat protein